MEAKQLKSEADESQRISKKRRVKNRGTSKHDRVKQKRASREADASGGTSKHKRKLSSRNQSDGRLGLIKCNMIKKKGLIKCKMIKKKRVSREQRGTDSFDGGSKIEESVCRFPNASDAEQRFFKRRSIITDPRAIAIAKIQDLEYAKTALKLYEEKNQDAEFEILQVMDFNCTTLQHPDLCPDFKTEKICAHISFTAKSKSDVSPKHFFGELFEDEGSGEFHAASCSTFDPSDDPGFDHGCVFCPPGYKLHPADGFIAGRPPWYVPKRGFSCRHHI